MVSRHERQRDLANAQMMIGRTEAALGLHRKIEIPVPITFGHDRAARRPNGQRKEACVGKQQALVLDGDLGRKGSYRGRAMVIAIVGEQGHAQRQLMLRRLRLWPQPPGGISRVGPRFHPDARLDAMLADLVAPHRNRVVEVKAADADVARGRDRAALPSVREERAGAFDHGRIGLGEDQPPSER
jgi:hypothetical protein